MARKPATDVHLERLHTIKLQLKDTEKQAEELQRRHLQRLFEIIEGFPFIDDDDDHANEIVECAARKNYFIFMQ